MKKERYDDVNIPVMLWTALFSCILTVLCILIFQTAFYYVQRQSNQASSYLKVQKSTALLEEQKQALNEPQLIDADKNLYTLPIDQAKELVVGEYSHDTHKTDTTDH
ncbi:MAG: hypothetical protein MPJ24_11445 [Pirellulaceae bacterium]|nr:hypothetical protein [Pirellulaceae bacterium]